MSEPRTGAADRIHAVTSASSVPGIRLVGVDGPAGAGKSTLARELSTRFGWPVVEIDDFFSWTGFHSWWPRFQSQVITPLLAGQDIRYQVRDWTGDEFGDGLAGWKELSWSPTVVLEGVGSTRSAVAAALACRVWVDAPAAERLERGIARDGESHRELWESYTLRERDFHATDRTRERADIHIDSGTRPLYRPERLAE